MTNDTLPGLAWLVRGSCLSSLLLAGKFAATRRRGRGRSSGGGGPGGRPRPSSLPFPDRSTGAAARRG